MKTNEIFNLRRFGKYFCSDFRTCTANFGLSLLTISVLAPIALYVLTIAFNGIFAQVWQGPGIGLRLFTFLIAMLCLTVTMPVKCYGKITEKQYGSFWISLPASRLEKFLSMVLMTCVIVPVIGITIYLALDWLNCIIDKTCEESIIAFFISLGRDMNEGINEIILNLGNLPPMEADSALTPEMIKDFFVQFTSPWLYIDELLAMSLPFLLGAIFFKNGKTVKTFLAIAAFSTIISMIASPLFAGYFIELMNGAVDDEEMAIQMFSSGLFQNMLWIDLISDTLTNVGLLLCIWFRLKTLKH